MNQKPAQKLLAICIPAYNEPEAICLVLDSIADELADPAIAPLVEVIIRDDASPSCNLAPVIAPYQARYPNIQFSRNPQNLGFDRNLLAVVGEASARYCWLMSDNDAFVSGALARIITLLRENPDIGYAYVQTQNYDGDLRLELSSRPPRSTEIKRLNSAEEFITNYDLPGFLSSQIIRKDLWDGVNKEAYLGNLWLHASVILEYLPKTTLLYIGTPLVKARNRNTWVAGGKNLTTFLSLFDITSQLPRYGYSPAMVKKFHAKFAVDLPAVVLYAKRRGLVVRHTTLWSLIKRFYSYPVNLAQAILYTLVPVQTLRQLRNLVKDKK